MSGLTPGTSARITPLPLQRASRDRRTFLLTGPRAIAEMCLLGRATGWSVWSATAEGGLARLTLVRD